MKVVCIIPARGGSKSIPKKNIIDFSGKPLIAWTIEQAKASQLISDVYVSSDSKEILKIADSYGADTILRPEEISDDNASSESALLHALIQINERPDLVVFLQTTSPLRKANDIDNAIRKLNEDNADSLFSLVETQEFIWEKIEEGFRPLTFDLENRCGHRYLKRLYYENGSIYVFRPEVLEKYNNRLGGKISVYLMESWQRSDIDDWETFDWCQWLFKKHFSQLFDQGAS